MTIEQIEKAEAETAGEIEKPGLPSHLLTRKDIAERIGTDIGRVQYLCLKYGINPHFRIGPTRIFHIDQLAIFQQLHIQCGTGRHQGKRRDVER